MRAILQYRTVRIFRRPSFLNFQSNTMTDNPVQLGFRVASTLPRTVRVYRSGDNMLWKTLTAQYINTSLCDNFHKICISWNKQTVYNVSMVDKLVCELQSYHELSKYNHVGAGFDTCPRWVSGAVKSYRGKFLGFLFFVQPFHCSLYRQIIIFNAIASQLNSLGQDC
jgi:hypothetical protein